MDVVLIVLALVALATATFFALKARKAAEALRHANDSNVALSQQAANLNQELASLREQVQRLGRYQTVVDADAEAASIRAKAEAATAEIRRQTDEWASQVRAGADATTAHASTEATRIVAEATRRAEETAAGALEAMRNVKRYEQTVEAMKNVIEGYGDRYVMPTAGLLDELAEEFGFAEAGKQLKAARDLTRSKIKDNLAATCDYVEANRRATAIEFVLDAFNGKVDTILADVRHDNYGTLQQKIRDAFTLVNHNGRAFRDARILPEFLDTRLEELRWAVVAQELKLKEREEQRVIKERIREEERARREFEKAQKETEKEQESIRKALEKARRDAEKATTEERAKYEERLRELTEKLHAAEEKNKRATSMAQQTKTGHVYIISNIGSFGEDVFKIGMTRRLEPQDRVRELGDASVPFEFDVHAFITSDDAPALEHVLHQRFVRSQVNKVNPRKEFFRVPLREIKQELERMKVNASWTMVAEAREFRETQAIERSMAEKTFNEAAWLEMQAKAEAASVQDDVVEAMA